jgi:hypothetical protein
MAPSGVRVTAATRALDAVLAELLASEITASRDAADFAAELGAIGVLIGLPSRVGGTLSAATFEIPVLVISGDPVNTAAAVDRLYAEADAIASALSTLSYRPTTWGGRAGGEPLSAIEITATVTVSEEV